MIPVKNQQISPKVVGYDALDAGDAGTSGSGSIDVPADADAVVFLVAHYNGATNFGFDSLSISGIEAETFMRIPQAVGNEYAMNVFGMRRPPTGTQTLSWTAGQSSVEAGRIYCVFLKDVIPHGQWIRDADGFHTDNGTERSPLYNLSSSPADIIVGTQGAFGGDLDNPSFHNETLLYNNNTYNGLTSDVFHAKGAQLNTFNRTGGYDWNVYFAASVMGRHAQWLPVAEEADTVDDLLANDVESASELTSPSLGQEHALTSADTESASELTSPSVGQEHGLLADDVQSTSELTLPDIGASHVLDATDVESTSEITTPTIGQTHAILADDVQSTSELTSPNVGQEHGLLADDVQSASEVTAPNLAEGEHTLLAEDIESTSELTAPVVGQEHALLADDVQSTSELTLPNLTEAAYQIFAEDIESASEVTAPVLGHIYNLTGVGVDSSSEVGNPVIGQEHSILADDIESASTVTVAALNAGSISRVVRLTGNFDFSIDLTGVR